jgi:alpha-beta hydrolase superfamily lysophospholipase
VKLRKARRRRVLALASLVALAALFAVACGDDAPEEPRPADGARIERITTADGLVLDARLFVPPAGFPERAGQLVVLLHMYPADQSAWWETARDLATSGVTALTLDFRGFGASEGDKNGSEIQRDVVAAIEWARARGYEEIVIAGASMGGTAAIVAVSEVGGVDGVLALSAPSSFRGLDADGALPELGVPLVAMAAEGDVSAADSLKRFEERCAPGRCEITLLPGRAHGTDMMETPEAPRVRRALDALMEQVWG